MADRNLAREPTEALDQATETLEGLEELLDGLPRPNVHADVALIQARIALQSLGYWVEQAQIALDDGEDG